MINFVMGHQQSMILKAVDELKVVDNLTEMKLSEITNIL